MDQPMEDVLDNSTHYTYENDLQLEIHYYLQTFVCILSILSDLLVVAIILKSKRMRTRTNNVIMHFAIADSLCMLNEMGLIYYVYEQTIYKMVPTRPYCMFAIYEVTSQFASLLFMIFLLSNTLIKTKRLSDKTLLMGYYALIGLTFLVHTLFCTLHLTYFPIFHMMMMIVFLITFVCLLVKEINRGYRFYRKRPVSEKTAFRMNIVRIYMYGWLITTFTFYSTHVLLLYLSLVGYFSGFFIILYLAYSDRNFKICLLNLLRFRAQSYDVDATIGFADDCSQSSDDGHDRPAVNITFNENANPQPEIHNVT